MIAQKSGPKVFYRSDKENKHGKEDYYYSKEVVEGLSPYICYIANKKWALSEEFSRHMIRYQQVGFTI